MAQRDFRSFAPRLRLFLELSTTLLKVGVARHDQQLHRVASGEHRHIAAGSRTATVSLGLGVLPAERAALELCSTKHSGVR